jgi:hypothetical protein
MVEVVGSAALAALAALAAELAALAGLGDMAPRVEQAAPEVLGEQVGLREEAAWPWRPP